jgi:UDP-N-acetylglucosamine--N-acetylmuramyl-(pentapeptide) pyrophosphoryl-undecaprenol N-acetylglucosamine transferase
MSVDFKEFHGQTVMLAAGGTGGHLFPAQALAEELVRRGYIIHLMTDERVKDYGKSFPALKVHEVPSATLSLSKPWLLPSRALRLWKGYRMARAILAEVKPIAVCGFGGYPSFPPLLAASKLDIPSCVHDQNAVMGRANRALAKMATAVASSFPTLDSLPESAKDKLTITGNPVRDLVLKSKAAPYAAPDANGQFNLLVFGGSQGAQFFSQFMPSAIKALPQAVLKSLKITQQCRPEDIDAVKAAYAEIGLAADLAPFFMDMPQRMAASHLVVARSGASTIAELGVIGRPAIMVPLPHAIDNDQLKNAESFAKAGAGWIMPQAEMTPDNFAAFFTRLRYQQGELNQAAQAALRHGKPDAAKRLADLIVTIAGEGQKRTA